MVPWQHLLLIPMLEERLSEGVKQTDQGISMVVEPGYAMKVLQRISAQFEKVISQGESAVLICSPEVRFPLKRFTEKSLPMLNVLAYTEVDPTVKIRTLGLVEFPEETVSSKTAAASTEINNN